MHDSTQKMRAATDRLSQACAAADQNEDILDVDEMAALLKVSKKTFYNRVKENTIMMKMGLTYVPIRRRTIPAARGS